MSADRAFGILLGLLVALVAVRLWRLRLHLELAATGTAQGPGAGLQLDAALALGPLRVEVERQPDAGRLVTWRLRLFGQRVREGARLLGAATGAPGTAATRSRRADHRPARLRLVLGWRDVVTWVLGQRPRLRVDRLEGWIAVGLDDPAASGALCGALWALVGTAAARARLEVVPVFGRSALDLDARAALTLQLLPVLLSAGWSLVTHLRHAARRGVAAVGAPLPSSPGAP